MPGKPKIQSRPTEDEADALFEDRQLALAIVDKSTDLETLQDSPALNRLLLKNARKSFDEISKMTGLPVGEVAERLSTLLDNRDWRDDLMEEKLLLAEMGMFMDDVRERMARSMVDDESWASMARVQLAAIKTMLEQLASRRKALNGQLATLTADQARMFADAIKLAHDMTIRALEAKYPDIDTDVIYAEFEEALPQAINYLENKIG